MGVTHIQIMPFFDYNDCVSSTAENTCFNWGYDPFNYNVRLRTTPRLPPITPNRILEVKQMIDNFHRQGIRIIMDVFTTTRRTRMLLGISRLTTTLERHHGTGNTLDGFQSMVARMIQDSLEYWSRNTTLTASGSICLEYSRLRR